MKIALAQINPIVGDITGNCALIRQGIDDAVKAGADIVIFPELAVIGYPPKDLLLRRAFVRRNVAAVEKLATHCRDIVAVIGFAEPTDAANGKRLRNSAAICTGGRVVHTHAKMLLPNYDVFDETRYFAPGDNAKVVTLRLGGEDVAIGFSICEDLWSHELIDGHRRYDADPLGVLAKQGAQLLVNLSASPFSVGKPASRRKLFKEQVLRLGVPLVYVNQVGGNDDLLFDGGSAFFSANGDVAAQAKYFDSDLLICDTQALEQTRQESMPDDLDSLRDALVLGTRDYVRKCGFSEVIVGVSGGIDSAVTAAIAAEAAGAEHVHAVAMPSRFSSDHSLADAEQLAKNLGIDYRVIPIEDCHASLERTLAPHFGDLPPGVAEENIQARVRGNLLMALSNKFGWLLLTTGNKSELAVGYCTMYGDMSGGLAVISDVPKTMVYELSRRINESAGRALIPESTLTKAPSAELRENQTDQDSLPPYDVLDAILAAYVETDASIDDLVESGFERATVERVAWLVDHNEYKRKQSATGLKVTSRAFGTGRRMPIAAKYR